jgi:hypothetical protein
MEKPTKILLGGLLCAGIIASAQPISNRRLENQVRQIQEECVAEGKRQIAEGKLLCNAEDLERLPVEVGELPRFREGIYLTKLRLT